VFATAIIVLIVLFAVNAWLVTAATAIRSVSRIWLRHWAQQDDQRAPAVKLYLSRPDQLLLAAGLGLTATIVLAGAVIGGESSSLWGLIVALIIAGAVILVGGQLVPRAIGRRWAKTLVPVVVPSLQAVAVLAAPLLWLSRAARAGVEPRDAVGDVFRDARREGVGTADDAAMVTSVVRFGGRVVRDVMTARASVFAIDVAMPTALAADAIARSAYSRVPVYRGSFDDVIGMVHAFDVLKAKPGEPVPVRPIARASLEAPLNDVMFAMLRDRVHMAVVADGAGRPAGIVTLEDLLETLVGNIEDEHDE
jgi:putative hemolysin